MNRVTWQWKEDDLALWYQTCPIDEAYKKRCRQWQNSCTLVAAWIGLSLVRFLAGSGVALLGVIVGIAAVYGILGWYLRGDNRFVRNQWIRQARKEFDPSECFTLVVEPEGFWILQEGAEDWYARASLVSVNVLPGGFVAILLKGMDEPFTIPPSAFTDTSQRDAFVQQLTGGSGPWWRQRSGVDML
nr:hypothetical protein [Armatimonas sp.]